LKQAELGRIATHSPIAEARRSATQSRQAEALRAWNPSELPKWLDEDAYRREILPRLASFPRTMPYILHGDEKALADALPENLKLIPLKLIPQK
jgi:hypothetical protein